MAKYFAPIRTRGEKIGERGKAMAAYNFSHMENALPDESPDLLVQMLRRAQPHAPSTPSPLNPNTFVCTSPRPRNTASRKANELRLIRAGRITGGIAKRQQASKPVVLERVPQAVDEADTEISAEALELLKLQLHRRQSSLQRRQSSHRQTGADYQKPPNA